MDNENMQRLGLYIEKDLIKRVDELTTQYGFKSRNAFFKEAAEHYIAEILMKENESPLGRKIAKAIHVHSKENSKVVSYAMFRMLVEMDVLAQILSKRHNISEYEYRNMREEAIKTIKHTKGNISFEQLLCDEHWYSKGTFLTNIYD